MVLKDLRELNLTSLAFLQKKVNSIVELPNKMYNYELLQTFLYTKSQNASSKKWGRLGFDRGYKAEQGISRAGDLVNPSRKKVNANDNSYALAA